LKFKIDENLPTEYITILERAGFQAHTVADENLSGADDRVLVERCRAEGRILVTQDLDFGNMPSPVPLFPVTSSVSFVTSVLALGVAVAFATR
jgi:hypothetical protein